MPLNISIPRTKEELDQIDSDVEWWTSMIPNNWKLFGFSGRNNASAIHIETRSFVELNPRFLCDLNGKNFEEEIKCL